MKYKVTTPLAAFYSHTNIPADPYLQPNMKDPNNIAYAQYNQPRNLVYIGGVDFDVPAGVPFSGTDILDFNGSNLTVLNPLTDYNRNNTYDARPTRKIALSEAQLASIGAGNIEFSGSITTSTTIYVFPSFKIWVL